MSKDDFESLLRWIERREPAYAEGLREHVAAARAEGYAAAREQAAAACDTYADAYEASPSDYDAGICDGCDESAKRIRAMQDGGARHSTDCANTNHPPDEMCP